MDSYTIKNVLKEQVKSSMYRSLIENEEVLNHISFLLAKVDVQVTEKNSIIVEVETKKYATYIVDKNKLYIVVNSFNDKNATLTIYSEIKEVSLNSRINDHDEECIESIELDDIKITPSEHTLHFNEFIETVLKTF